MAKRILRPMGYAEILDEVFDVYKKNFIVVVAITAVIHLIAYSATYNFQGESRGFGIYFLTYPLTSLSSAAIIYAISMSYLQRSPTVISSYRAILPKALRLMVTALLSIAVSLVSLVFLIVPGIIMFIYLAFVYQVVVLEDVAYLSALKRSFRLVRGQWMRVFTLTSITFLIAYVIEQALTAPAVYWSTGQWRIFGYNMGTIPLLVNFAASTLTTPIYYVASVIIYYDLRVRKEGFDVELLAKEMSASLPLSVKTTAD